MLESNPEPIKITESGPEVAKVPEFIPAPSRPAEPPAEFVKPEHPAGIVKGAVTPFTPPLREQVESSGTLEVARLVTIHRPPIVGYEILEGDLDSLERLHGDVLDSARVVSVCASSGLAFGITLLTVLDSLALSLTFGGLLIASLCIGGAAQGRCNSSKQRLGYYFKRVRSTAKPGKGN